MDTADAPKQTVRVTIFNQTYSLSTSGNPQDTEAIAHEVDELMYAIARRAGNLDSGRTAVLACLHLADRLRATEQKLGSLTSKLASKANEFASLLDQLLPIEEPEQSQPELENTVLPLHTAEIAQISD